jgi:cyclopropane fatty-acyl-phospholipid synthase-like methyltransferase
MVTDDLARDAELFPLIQEIRNMPHDASFYEDRLAKEKDPRMAVWDATEEDYARCKRETIEILKPHVKPGMWILDAGCGIGELLECLGELPFHVNYLGIDYCGGFIETARKRYRHGWFEQCDLLDLSKLELTSFDLVICRTVEGVVGSKAWGSVIKALLALAPKILVFRAMLADGEMANTVEVIERGS